QTRDRLESPDGLQVEVDRQPRHLVAGENLLVSARFRAVPGSVIEGTVVYWTDLGEKLSLVRLGEAGRVALPIKDGQPMDVPGVSVGSPDLRLAEQNPPVDARPERSEVTWNAYYRGQRPQAAMPVWLHPVPESTRVDYAP